MFGYIKPLQGELKVRELERFKACYCGMCFTLRRKYGLFAGFVLNYELVFLSMLLDDETTPLTIKRKRCLANPLRKRKYCDTNAALDLCAGYTVILAWWKLHDSITDNAFFRSVPNRVMTLFLNRAYKKAKLDFPDFDSVVEKQLFELDLYEKSNYNSLDEAADKFAAIFKMIDLSYIKTSKQRILNEILYHIGRWIYIIDAYDDMGEDINRKQYNPILRRFLLDTGNISEEHINLIRSTLIHSNNLIILAFELLPAAAWTEIIRNIIYLGMPDTCECVLKGKKNIN